MHARIGLILVALPLLSAPGMALQATAQERALAATLPAPTNLYGAPVIGLKGAKIEYDEDTLQAQHDAWLAQGGGLPEAPLPGCESSIAEADWKYYAFGTGIGQSNFALGMVEGEPELVVSCGGYGFGGNRYWMILSKDAAGSGYQQEFVGPIYATSGIRWLEVADVDMDPGPEIVVVLQDGTVEIWDQTLRKLQGGFQTVANVQAMRLHDIDADGSLEVLVATSSAFYAYSLSAALEWTVGVGGSDIAVGQMDGDAALEVALTGGHVVDAGTHDVQWTWASGFGSYLECGDIDGDGLEELIGTQTWDFSWAYDVDTQLPKWSLPLFNVGATHLLDIDADGTLELLVGEAQWGDIRAFDTVTLLEEWAIDNPEHGTTEVIVGDVDGDTDLEVIWGSGHSSSGPDYMFVADWQTQQHQWQSVHLDGPFRGPARGDVDGDLVPEMVVVCNESESGYGGGRILVFDDDLRLLGISQELAGGLTWTGTYDVILRDVDSDPALEIVVAGSWLYDGTIEIYDYEGGSDFTLLWEVPSPKPDGAFRAVEVIDVDEDGDLEVIGCAGQYVYSYDYGTSVQEWQSLAIVSGASDLAIAHTDEDPALEILALGSDGDLRVFDGQTGALEALLFGEYTSLEITPMVVLPDLVRLTNEGGDLVTFQFQSSSYQQIETLHLLDDPIEGVTFGNAETLWVSSGGVLSLFYPPYTGALWESCSAYGSPFGRRTVYGSDCLLTTGMYGVVAFRRHQGD